MWDCLPDLLLEDVFLRLGLKDRYEASLTCRYWNYVFHSPRLWRSFEVGERSFTIRRYNMFKGYEYEIRHDKVQKFLSATARAIKTLTIKPMKSYYNLYEFMRMICSYVDWYDEDYALESLKFFNFTFACEIYPQIVGTGGRLLEEVKLLLSKFIGLEGLAINNLLLEYQDCENLLNHVISQSRDTLRCLELINPTKTMYPYYCVCGLTNLRTFITSPTQMTDDMVVMLAMHETIRDVVLVQDRYYQQAVPVNSLVWLEVKQIAPKMRFHLKCKGRTDEEILLQENAPVESVQYNTSTARINAGNTIRYADNYRKYLTVFAHYGIPRKLNKPGFHDRADSHLVFLIRECPSLKTLVIRERVSTMTLLVLAREGRSLRQLIVRKNAVLLRADWPKSCLWSDDEYKKIKATARSYDKVEEQIAEILHQPNWRMLSDKEFVALKEYI